MTEIKINAKNPKKIKNLGFFMRIATIVIIIIATIISAVFSGLYLKDGGSYSLEFGGGYQVTVDYEGATKDKQDIINLLEKRVDPLGTSNINIEQNSNKANSFNVAISKDVGVNPYSFINNISRRGYFYLVDKEGHDLLGNSYDSKEKKWDKRDKRIVSTKAFGSITNDTNLNSKQPEVAFSGINSDLVTEISGILGQSDQQIYVYSDIGVLLNYIRNTYEGLQDLVSFINKETDSDKKEGLEALLSNNVPGFDENNGSEIVDVVNSGGDKATALRNLLSPGTYPNYNIFSWKYFDASTNPNYQLSVDTNNEKSGFDPAKPFDPNKADTGSPMNSWLAHINDLILLPDISQILNTTIINYKYAPFFVGSFSNDPSSASKFDPTAKKLTINDGSFNEEKVQQISNILNAGLAKNNFTVKNFVNIDPTLGATALKFSMMALLVSLLVLSVVILFKYRLLGILAMTIIGLFLSATLVTFIFLGSIIAPETGIALILSFALLLDAIIGLFNRLQKEYRTGKTTFNAFKAANKKSLSAAFDGNIIVLIVSLTIFWFGSRSIRGFAIMASLSTFGVILLGIVILRIILYFLLRNNAFEEKPYLLGLTHETRIDNNEQGKNNKLLNFQTSLVLIKDKVFKKIHINKDSKILHISQWNFWNKSTKWIMVGFGTILLLSGITYLAAGAHFGQGFDSRSDFTGEAVTPEDPADPHNPSLDTQIQNAINATSASLKANNKTFQHIYGASVNSLNNGKITILVIIQTNLSGQQALDFKSFLSNNVSSLSWSYHTADALSGQNLFINMIIAIAISLITIFIYVIIRFQLAFTIPLILALVFGILLTLALVSMLQITISNMIIGVILGITILILINSVVIFDNIKEIKLNNNERKNKLSKLEIIAISNEGIKKSLIRTLALNSIIILASLIMVCFVPSLWAVSLSMFIGTIATFTATHFFAPWLWTFFERWRIKRYAKRIEKIKKHFVGPDEYIVKGIND